MATHNDLPRPELPTFASGSSIDGILFSPGRYVPSIFLPPGNLRADGLGVASDSPYYPARVVDYRHIGYHAPIMLPLPCDSEGEIQRRRRIRVTHLDEEAWREKDQQLSVRLEELILWEWLTRRLADVGRCFKNKTQAITDVFYDERRQIRRPSVGDP